MNKTMYLLLKIVTNEFSINQLILAALMFLTAFKIIGNRAAHHRSSLGEFTDKR